MMRKRWKATWWRLKVRLSRLMAEDGRAGMVPVAWVFCLVFLYAFRDIPYVWIAALGSIYATTHYHFRVSAWRRDPTIHAYFFLYHFYLTGVMLILIILGVYGLFAIDILMAKFLSLALIALALLFFLRRPMYVQFGQRGFRLKFLLHSDTSNYLDIEKLEVVIEVPDDEPARMSPRSRLYVYLNGGELKRIEAPDFPYLDLNDMQALLSRKIETAKSGST